MKILKIFSKTVIIFFESSFAFYKKAILEKQQQICGALCDNLKNVKNTPRGVLLLVKLVPQWVPPWVFFTFFKL